MTMGAAATATITAALAREGRGRHGVQLALAVLAAYAVSASFGLPESLWAVMSALIVVRPNTGTTLSAGWTRLAGTLFGTLAGIAGVWLRHHGASLPVVTLSVVAGLAFASAVVFGTGILFGLAPALRATVAAPGAALKDDTRTSVGPRTRLAPAVVVFQLALSLVLLIGNTITSSAGSA